MRSLNCLRIRAKVSKPEYKPFTISAVTKGISQLQRFIRQQIASHQALVLLEQDKGVDPVTGLHVEVIEVGTELASWDDALSGVMTEALTNSGPATGVVDGCLWIYADASKDLSRNKAAARFGEILTKKLPATASSFRKRWPTCDADRIACLNEGFWPPLALPLFLRNLAAPSIAAATYGRLMFRLFLYIDWDAFGRLVEAGGGKFSWSSEKDMRRARAMKPKVRPVIARGRIPQIHTERAVWSVTDPMLVQMFFDGITPRSIVRQILDIKK